MNRSVAVTRIQDGLGFTSNQSDKIILRLQEAQRELEMGKTLPPFLLRESQTLSLLTGTSSVALPTGFLRIDDAFRPYFIAVGATSPTFVDVKRNYSDALEANYSDETEGPKVMVVRKSTVDFITQADANYTIVWQYYASGAPLTGEIENEWLANGAEWLIGEAGWRMAMDKRDKDAISIFDGLRKMGRAAVFGEIIADEEASGPLLMGVNL